MFQNFAYNMFKQLLLSVQTLRVGTELKSSVQAPSQDMLLRSKFEIGNVVLVRPDEDSIASSGQRFWLAQVVELSRESEGFVSVRWFR